MALTHSGAPGGGGAASATSACRAPARCKRRRGHACRRGSVHACRGTLASRLGKRWLPKHSRPVDACAAHIPLSPTPKKHERSLTSRRRRPTCGALPLQVMPEASHTLTWGTRPRVGEWQPPEPAMARPAPPDPRPKGRSEGLLARSRVAHAGHLHGRQSPPRNPTRSHPLAPRALSQGLRYRLGPLPRVSGLGELVRVPAPAAQLRETSLARVGHQTTDGRVPPPACLFGCPRSGQLW